MTEFENSTRDGVSYLQNQNRNSFIANSEAKIEEMFSSGFFDSRARKLLNRDEDDLSVGSDKTRGQRGRFASSNNQFQGLITNALPSFYDDLASVNSQIQGINPKQEGAYGRSREAGMATRELQSQLFNILNQSPQKLDGLMEGVGLSGRSRELAEEYIDNLATELLNRANTLLEIENNLKQYDSLDPEIKKEERKIAKVVIDRRRDLLGEIADVSEDIKEITKADEDLSLIHI